MAEPNKWWEDPVFDFVFNQTQSSFTGYGEDGKLQPSNPVDMVQTNQGVKMLHEGEMRMTKPDGSMAVIPANRLPQDQLRQIEAVGKVGGYATGVTFTGSQINTNPVPKQPSVDPLTETSDTAVKTGLDTLTGYAQGKNPYQVSLANQTMTSAGASAAAANAARKMEMGQTGADKGTMNTANAVAARDTQSNLSKLSGQLALGSLSAQQSAASAAASAGQNQQQFQYNKMSSERNYSDQENQRINSDIGSGMTYSAFSLVHPEMSESEFNSRRKYTSAGQTDVTQAEKDWNEALKVYDPSLPRGLKTLQDLYVKQHPGQPAPDMKTLIDEKAYTQTKRTQDITQGQMSIAQQAWNEALNVYDPSTPQGLKVLQDLYVQQHPGQPAPNMKALIDERIYIQTKRSQDVTTGQLSIDSIRNQIGDANFNSIKTKIDANVPYEDLVKEYPNLTRPQYTSMRTVADINLSSLQQTLGDAKFNTAMTMIEAGIKDPNDINAKTGLNLNDAQIMAMGEVRKINIDSLKNKLKGDQIGLEDMKFNQIQARIAAGAPLETINNELGINLTDTEYQAIRKYTNSGTVDFNNQLMAATTAFNAKNNEAGEVILKQLFPNSNLDFTKLNDAQKLADYEEGASLLNEFSQNLSSFEDQFDTMKKMGVFDKLGYDVNTEDGMKKAKDDFTNFRIMTDPIYKATNTIQDSTIQKLWPERTGSPEALAKTKRELGLFMVSGGVTYDADGKPVISPAYKNLWDDLTSTTNKNIATNIPTVTKTGDSAEVKRGTPGYKFATTKEADTAWTKFTEGASANKDADAMAISRAEWEGMGSPEITGYDPNAINYKTITDVIGSGSPERLKELTPQNVNLVVDEINKSKGTGSVNSEGKETAYKPDDYSVFNSVKTIKIGNTEIQGVSNLAGMDKSKLDSFVKSNAGKVVVINGKMFMLDKNATTGKVDAGQRERDYIPGTDMNGNHGIIVLPDELYRYGDTRKSEAEIGFIIQ